MNTTSVALRWLFAPFVAAGAGFIGFVAPMSVHFMVFPSADTKKIFAYGSLWLATAIGTALGGVLWVTIGSVIAPHPHRRLAFPIFFVPIALLAFLLNLAVQSSDTPPSSGAVALGLLGACVGLLFAEFFLTRGDIVQGDMPRLSRSGGPRPAPPPRSEIRKQILQPVSPSPEVQATPAAAMANVISPSEHVEPTAPERDNVFASSHAEKEAKRIFEAKGIKPSLFSSRNWKAFGPSLSYSFRLVTQEREIILFAALQWLTIAIAYLAWTKGLDWIPDSLWTAVGEAIEKDERGPGELAGWFLILWSDLIIVAASYPISILNGAITVSHYLRSMGETSTITRCLNLASRNAGRLWLFTALDAITTAFAILDRLPKKRGRRKAVDEVSYYAWKIGTIGITPALAAGKGYRDAVKDSLTLLVKAPIQVIGIRMAYSLICWIVGCGTYVGAVIYLMNSPATEGPNEIYNFYVLIAGPIVVATGVTTVFLRPFYVIMVSKLYTDVIPLDHKMTAPNIGKKFHVQAAAFGILLCAIVAGYFLGDELGIRQWVESLAVQDLSTYDPDR